MKFVLCSSWSLPVQLRGAHRCPCLALWAAEAPQVLGMTTSASTALLQQAGNKRGEDAMLFHSASLALNSQVGNDRDISLDITLGNVGALERALPVGLKLGRWGMTGPSVFMDSISGTHQGQALKSRVSIQNGSGVLEVGVRHLPVVLLQLILH